MRSDQRSFWGHAFATYQTALQDFFRRRVTHAWDIQDLAQEVYVRLLRVDDRAVADPRAYLFTVASNLLKEHSMLQKRHALNVDIAHLLPELEAPQISVEDEIEHEQLRNALGDMLDRLPPRCKAVLLMQHRDGMSYQEIAERLGVSTHMVKKYVVKALTLCRQDMARKK